MAELIVGGALLSGFINVLFDRLASEDVLNFFRGNKLNSRLLNKLKTMLRSANVLLNDAEEKQLEDSNVKEWLDELKQVLYQADHVVDKINTEALRLNMTKKSKSLNFVKKYFSSFESNVKYEIEGILDNLKGLLAQTEYLGLKKIDLKTTMLLHKPPAPLLDVSKVYGRESDKNTIVKLLLSDDDDDYRSDHRFFVIPIVGMGGIGKTTLTYSVYDDSVVLQHFDLKAWVTVSDDFDVYKITKIILETITSHRYETNELRQLQVELKKMLMGKKFLFVFDDVWNENYGLWDSLKCSFESSAHGSMVIVTTRNREVALMMKTRNVQPYELQPMSDCECWKLFAEHVFDDTSYNNEMVPSELKEIGEQIVKKCKGLPLAVKSMAGLLRSMSTCKEWRHVLQSDVWELPKHYDIGIVPALWLSYYFLPSYLKPCFSYLSIFPKNYEFWEDDREKIILIWMAEGLLQPQKEKRMEDVGEEYLNALISRSFFQRSLNQHDFFFLSMHDLVHDLAIYASGQCCFIYDGCEDSPKLTSKTRHLSYMKKEVIELSSFPKVKFLRTLLALPLRDTYSSHMTRLPLEMVLGDGGYLRTLSLSKSCIKELPYSIGNLKHLRYLDVSYSGVKELPTSICVLYNLETLLLSGCKELQRLPTNISKLTNLRHLMIKHTPLKEMPPKICNMVNLQTLSDFVLCENNGSRIKELGKLENLHGRLCISGLQYVKEVSDVSEANLKKKEYLTKLVFSWKGKVNDNSTKEIEVLNALQPHTNLKKLTIFGYNGTNLPDWVANPSYSNLGNVRLDCKNCCLSLLSFQQLSSLSCLRISCLDMNEEIQCISLNKPFLFLIRLELFWTNILDWSFANTNDQNRGIFSCLKQIDLRKCGKLNVALPNGSFPYLEVINVVSCDELVTIFPKSTHIDISYPSLEVLNIISCSRLESFSEMGVPSTLKSLYITSCNMLMENRMKWNLQRLSSLNTLELHRCGSVVDSFPEEWLLPPTLSYLKIFDFYNLKALNGEGFQHNTYLRHLELLYLEKLESLTEGLPRRLNTLCIEGCNIVIPRCKEGTGEDWPKIQHIPNILTKGSNEPFLDKRTTHFIINGRISTQRFKQMRQSFS